MMTKDKTATNMESETVTVDNELDYDQEIANLKLALSAAENNRLRALADWENARKQYDNDLKEIRRYRSYSLITELLPIIDNFERALNVKNVSNDVQNFLKGFEMMINDLKTTLKNEGVTEIIVKEKDLFDGHLHHAIEQISSDSHQPNEIIKVLQKGYYLHDRVLRVATVQIAKEANSSDDLETKTEKEGH